MKKLAIAIAVMVSLWGTYEVGQHMTYKGICDTLGVPKNGYIMVKGMKLSRQGLTETIEKYSSTCSRCHFGKGY